MTIESYQDHDPQETREWMEALAAVLEREGPQRAHHLLETLIAQAREAGADIPFSANTAYLNSIPLDQEVNFPGNTTLEHTIRSYVRWNALAMVVRANKHKNDG